MSNFDHGTPFAENSTEPIDDWSRAVFNACKDWPLARSGRWYRVEDGWLRLRIEEVDGEPLEPLFAIDVDMGNWEILVDCGSWASPITPPSGPLDQAAELTMAKARDLIQNWLCGDTRLAAYSDETGLRGHKLIKDGELPSAIEPVPVEIGNHARVIVKTPWRREWRTWQRMSDGLWLECENIEG